MVSLISREKVRALAGKVLESEGPEGKGQLSDCVATATAKLLVERLSYAWRSTAIRPNELASMILAASHAFEYATRRQSTELVWTGPTTPFVSARRTEQALLQVIGSAKHTLFIVSFVAYNASNVVKALNDASMRGVKISMLLESSKEHGGSLSFDAVGNMRALVPSATLYGWCAQIPEFVGGRVHAKIVVADRDVCFVTSANLTAHAMEKNMEAGILIAGGDVPSLAADHFAALVDMQIILSV